MEKIEEKTEEKDEMLQQIDGFTKIKNLMRHDVKVIDESDETVKHYKANNEPAYVQEKATPIRKMNEMPCYVKERGTTKNLPNNSKDRDTLYIVSQKVILNEPTRKDLITPIDTVEYENDTLVCRGFEVHADLEREMEDRKEWRRWNTCPSCGKTVDYKRWKRDRETKKGELRRVTQLHRRRKDGANVLTVQIPSIRKVFDLKVRGSELMIVEMSESDDKKIELEHRKL